MTMFVFTLRYRLPSPDDEPEQYLEALYAAGCSDALVGTARRGSIALSFSRAAEHLPAAIESARYDVEQAIPGGEFVEVVG